VLVAALPVRFVSFTEVTALDGLVATLVTALTVLGVLFGAPLYLLCGSLARAREKVIRYAESRSGRRFDFQQAAGVNSHVVSVEDERQVTADVGVAVGVYELVEHVRVHRLVEGFQFERVLVGDVGDCRNEEFARFRVRGRVVMNVVSLRSALVNIVS
jgi:hypothetical protein